MNSQKICIRWYSRPTWSNFISAFKFKNKSYDSVSRRLKEIYKGNLLPLEESTFFHELQAPRFYDADFDAKPSVLLMGQYSTGKTSLIRYILQQDFPGMRIGPEPTTDKFISIMYGKNSSVIPGNALAADNSKPYVPLSKYGNGFLTKFQCSLVPSTILEGINIIDTPGILSGEKQRLDRGYDFSGVLEWFAARVDRIVLLFDANKLDISDEFKNSIMALRGNEEKIRIVLNKSDSQDVGSLMRIYGSLMWSLGKVMNTPEVSRVYIGSFWDKPYLYSDMRKLFEEEEKELLIDLQSLQGDSVLRKINDISKRARLVKVHALLVEKLHSSMPKLIGRDKRKKQLIENLKSIYETIEKDFGVACGDFLPVPTMQERLKNMDFSRFKSIKEKDVSAVDGMSELISKLMDELYAADPKGSGPKDGVFERLQDVSTPFGSVTGEGFEAGIWEEDWVVAANRGAADAVFDRVVTSGNKMSRIVARTEMLKSGLPSGTLGQIYALADDDKDGLLNRDEFALAQYIIQLKVQGFDLPTTLPPHLAPPKPKG